MDSGNPTLDNLFNNLSSVYNTDNGMLNSNMYVILNAYAQMFDNATRTLQQVSDDTYILSADASALESNFGTIINFPFPPRLNSTPNGDNIYRFMLSSMFQYFFSGSTVATMQSVLQNCLSLLTTDPNTTSYLQVVNYSQLNYYDTSIVLSDNAVKVSGGQIIGAAGTGDIFINPPTIGVSSYDPTTSTVYFTGTVQSGVTYEFLYNRDNSSYNGTNWMNLTNQNIYNVSPMDLGAGPVPTFNNPEFSYWWNNFNADGQGVVINEFEITASDSSIVWRLPEQAVSYVSPYTGQVIEQSFDFYNLSGSTFDLTTVSEYNPDVLFDDTPQDYLNDVSGKPSNYYVRYSANNNGPYQALSAFSGTFTKYAKSMSSISFPSSNFGTLDFFEMGAGFNPSNPFGSGTAHIWMNVPNVGGINGSYILNNTNFFPRQFSLHEDIKYDESFNNGIGAITGNFYSYSGNTVNIRVTEPPSTPIETEENCILLSSVATGTTTYIYPIIDSGTVSSVNYLQVDFFDPLNSLTSTYVDVIATGSSNNYQQFRFGIDALGLYGTPIITGVSGALGPNQYTTIFTGTQNFGFLETYFNSYGSFDYVFVDSLNPSPYIVPPTISGSAIAFTGNPYSIYSTGTYISNYKPNYLNTLGVNVTGNSLLINADTLEIDFNVSLGGSSGSSSGTDFYTVLRIATPAGPLTIRNGAYFGDGLYFPQGSSPIIVGTSTNNITALPQSGVNAYFQPLGLANAASPTINVNNVWLYREYVVGGTKTSPWFTMQSSGEQVISGTLTVGTGTVGYNDISYDSGQIYSIAGGSYTNAPYTTGRHDILISRASGTITIDGNVQTMPAIWTGTMNNAATAWQNGVLFFDPSTTNPLFWGPVSSGLAGGAGNDGSFSLAFDVEPTSNNQYVEMYKFFIGNLSNRQSYLTQTLQALTYANIADTNYAIPYYYQTTNTPGSIASSPKNYINGFSRSENWHRLTFDLGTGFSGITASIDDYQYYSNPNIGFSGVVQTTGGFQMNVQSYNPVNEFAYFDNIKLSYYNANALLPKYSGVISNQFWQGSYLEQSTIVDNKFFKLEPVLNYQFNVEIQGLEEEFIFIMNNIIDRIKPAHTLALPIYLLEQTLDTTSNPAGHDSNPATDWETGYIGNNIVVGVGTTPNDPTDLPGFIGVSGLSATGTSA